MFDYSCHRCGQSAVSGRGVALQSDGHFVCDACRAADRAPQGEAVRLFTPAPAQLEGQGFWSPDELARAAGDTPGFTRR